MRFAPRPTLTALAAALLGTLALPAAATNGMNLEAYGAKAGGMGGASFAYENGNSALMNNPATLGLRQDGQNLGLGLTVLMPDVKTMIGPMTFPSGGDQYLMPSISYIRKCRAASPTAWACWPRAVWARSTATTPSAPVCPCARKSASDV